MPAIPNKLKPKRFYRTQAGGQYSAQKYPKRTCCIGESNLDKLVNNKLK